jgi:hypothetical protein
VTARDLGRGKDEDLGGEKEDNLATG